MLAEPTVMTCPNCRKTYEPVLGQRKTPHLLIQNEFPDSEPWEREQLVTGLCSDRCWDEFLGVPESQRSKDL